MNIDDLIKDLDQKKIGEEIYALIEELFPICRSITGDGLRETLRILQKHIPLEIHEIPSGTQVFDWTIPKEWNIKDAYVKNSKGERIIDFKKSNLHILNYSIPIQKTVSLSELKEHLFTIPEHPDWIPYKTSYYSENWGFCLSHNQMLMLEEDDYEVLIDSSLEDGHLTYGEFYLKGEVEDEVLISSHACHPSLANDNLSGVSVSVILAKYLSNTQTRYSYRFVFIPGTIGAITWLCRNEASVDKIKHGLVVSGVGDSGSISYKKSRRGDAEIDLIAEHIIKHSGEDFQLFDFNPYGYDERQYCSPGFNLPVGRISRTQYGSYPEYHTSEDNLDFIYQESLFDSFLRITSILNVLENNRRYINLNPKCEPQLGKRNLYKSFSENEHAMLWVLNLSDGYHSLLDIAKQSGLKYQVLHEAASALKTAELIEE